MIPQEIEIDVEKVLSMLPRFANDYNRGRLLSEVYAQGQPAVVIFEELQNRGQLKKNDDLALHTFYRVHPGYRGVQANEKWLKEVAAAVPQPTVENILAAFEKIKDRLVSNSDYTDAFVELFRKYPTLARPGVEGGDANVQILQDALAGQDVTFENLEDLLQPGNPRNVLGQLVVDATWEAQQAEQRERHTLIMRISEGRPTYMSRRPYDGKVEEWKTAELQEESTQRLREIAAFLAQQRGELRMTKDELRTKNKAADAERLRQLMDNYPRLPATMFIGGQETTLDAVFFKRLASTDLEYFKKFVRDYGRQAIDARLRGE